MKVYVVRHGDRALGIYSTWAKASEAISMILYFSDKIEVDGGLCPTSDYTITEEEVR